jgi:hypothetical protein
MIFFGVFIGAIIVFIVMAVLRSKKGGEDTERDGA